LTFDLSFFFAGYASHPPEAYPSFDIRELLGSNRGRRRFAGDTRMKNADWLDVVAAPDRITTRPRSDLME
jgi:hypothetical protein